MATPLDLNADWSDLNDTDMARLREEIRLSRDMRQLQVSNQRIPYLPVFSGDHGIDLDHYLSAVFNISYSNNDQQVIQAIRKSVTGSAEKVISILDYSTSKADILRQLKANFEKVSDTASSWQKFYSATQSSKETIIDWRSRIQDLYKKTGNKNDSDLHLRTKLYTGLYSQKLKDQVLWKYEDDTSSEEDLFRLLRKLTDKSSPIASAAITRSEPDQSMIKEIEELRAQVHSLSINSKDKSLDKVKPRRDNGSDWESKKRSQVFKHEQKPGHRDNKQRFQYDKHQVDVRHNGYNRRDQYENFGSHNWYDHKRRYHESDKDHQNYYRGDSRRYSPNRDYHRRPSTHRDDARHYFPEQQRRGYRRYSPRRNEDYRRHSPDRREYHRRYSPDRRDSYRRHSPDLKHYRQHSTERAGEYHRRGSPDRKRQQSPQATGDKRNADHKKDAASLN